MKKTFPVNICGKVFYIDEDAYELLLNYLDQIRSSFTGSEGEEIAQDIESRICEHFAERVTGGAQTIVYADVNRVIEIMGKPSDISDNEPGTTTGNLSDTDAAAADQPQINEEVPVKHLYRNVKNKMLGGVIGGLAIYLGWNANIMRLFYVILTLCTIEFIYMPMIPLYLVAWMVIPPANTPRRVLEQQGAPVTVDNISQNILSAVPPPCPDKSTVSIGQAFSSAFALIRKFFMTIVGLAGLGGAFVATGFFVYFLVAFIAYAFYGNVTLLDPVYYRSAKLVGSSLPYIISLSYMMFSLCFIIPAIALTWMAASSIFNYKGASKATILLGLTFETIIIVTTIILHIFMEQGIYNLYH